MRPARAPKVVAVEEDTVAAEVDKVVVDEEVKAVAAEVDKAVVEEGDKVAADKDQKVATACNPRLSRYSMNL